jgi:membrane-associated protease RseP (regulator of RpoE activity)
MAALGSMESAETLKRFCVEALAAPRVDVELARALIGQLSAESPGTRREASDKLLKLAPHVRDLLIEAAKKIRSPVARGRIEQILSFSANSLTLDEFVSILRAIHILEAQNSTKSIAALRELAKVAQHEVVQLAARQAISRLTIKPAIEAMSFGPISRPALGVAFSQWDGIQAHPRVIGVVRDSPAAKAGIRVNDRIVRIAGREVPGKAAVAQILALQTVGARVPIELKRGEESVTLEITVSDAPMK